MVATDSPTMVIKDPVHGYIDIPKPIADAVIDTPVFQRLQEVSQTGMKVLYPNATHNRFCHSLGVYYLGKKSFFYFRRNVRHQYEDIYQLMQEPNFPVNSSSSNREEADIVWDKWQFLFELACLLHDCGHSPFSHSLEDVYDCPLPALVSGGKNPKKRCYSYQYLCSVFGEQSDFAQKLIKEEGEGIYGAPHERMSCCVMIQEYAKRIFDLLKAANFFSRLTPQQQNTYNSIETELENLYAAQRERPDKTLGLRTTEESLAFAERLGGALEGSPFRDDLEFMTRCIIGYPYRFDCDDGKPQEWVPSATYQMKNCIIGLLNSNLDADNLDYTVRDSATSGYSSSAVDIERLLRSRTITVGARVQDCTLKEKHLDHELVLEGFSHRPEHGTFQATISGPFIFKMEKGSHGTERFLVNGKKRPRVKFFITEENDHVDIEGSDCCFTIMPRNSRPTTNIHICGIVSGFFTGCAYGEGSGTNATNTGNASDDADPVAQGKKRRFPWQDDNTEIRINPAFHKSALSVLQGAYDANNFESQWIYSHHKTTYYNSFLVFCLLDTYCKILQQQNRRALIDLVGDVTGTHKYRCAKELRRAKKSELQGALAYFQGLLKGKQDADEEKGKISAMNTRIQTAGWADDSLQATQALEILQAIEVLRCAESNRDGTAAETKLQQEESGREWTYEDLWSEEYTKLWNDLEQLTGAGRPKSERADTMTRVRQIRAFWNLTGDVIYDMYNVIGMTGHSVYGDREFYRSSDYDLLSRYREMRRELESKLESDLSEPEERFLELSRQIEGRDYCRPLWKSHAEYAFYVQNWSPEEKESINHLLSNKASSNSPSPKSAASYIYLSEKHSDRYGYKALWEKLKQAIPNLKMIVIVPQKIRKKTYDLRKTYITWKTRVVNLMDLTFRQTADGYGSFFYIYYKTSNDGTGPAGPTPDPMTVAEVLRDNLSKGPTAQEPAPAG